MLYLCAQKAYASIKKFHILHLIEICTKALLINKPQNSVHGTGVMSYDSNPLKKVYEQDNEMNKKNEHWNSAGPKLTNTEYS